MTLTEIIGSWLLDATRMHGGPPNVVAVTEEVFGLLGEDRAASTR